MRGHGVALLAGVLLPSVAGCALGPPAREDDGAPRPQAASLHKGWGPEQFEADRRCNAGEKPACSQLGRFLIVSAVDGDDVRRGYVLLEAACNDGDRAACTALGERLAIYDESRERGRQLLIAACQQRWAEACTLYGNVIQGRDFRSPEAGRWYLMGCDLGDANGCERYGWAGFHGHQQAMAVDGFGKACKLGSRPNCHIAGEDPGRRSGDARGGGAAV